MSTQQTSALNMLSMDATPLGSMVLMPLSMTQPLVNGSVSARSCTVNDDGAVSVSSAS